MTTYRPRSAWTSHGPAKTMKPLAVAPLRGFAVHWPGSGDKHIDATNEHSIASRLEGYRAYHVNGHGWSDIAYQVAVDQAGRVWDCRGIRWQSAANGNQATNASHGAVLLLLGDLDVPSPALIQAVREWRQNVWLKKYPKATRVVGHRDLFSTDCPGPAAYTHVKKGTFAQAPAKPPVVKPPVVPPTTTRKPLMTDYVFGTGQDGFTAVMLSANYPRLLPLFHVEQAREANAGGNRILVLGGPAVSALGLLDHAPAGSTSVIGNFTCANGLTGGETITRGIAAAQTLSAG